MAGSDPLFLRRFFAFSYSIVESSDYVRDNFGFSILLNKLLVCECVCAMSPCHAHNRLSLSSLPSLNFSQGSPGPEFLGRRAFSHCGDPVSLSNPGSCNGVAHQPGPAILVFMYFIGFRIFSPVAPHALNASSLSPFPFSIDASKIFGFSCRIQ